MYDLVIASTMIRRDSDGRYSLNDLHRAAVAQGANERTKEPGKFLDRPDIVDLIAELSDTQNLGIAPVRSIRGGNDQGTYGIEQLVVAYAAWISPKFHLAVLNTFLAVQRSNPTPSAPRMELIQPEFDSACTLASRFGMTGNQLLLSASNAIKRLHGVDPMALIGVTHLVAKDKARHFTPTELGDRLGLSGQKLNRMLCEAGLQEKRDGQWCATSKGEAYAVVLDTNKRHSSGTPVTQLKWLDTVMPLIEPKKAA